MGRNSIPFLFSFWILSSLPKTDFEYVFKVRHQIPNQKTCLLMIKAITDWSQRPIRSTIIIITKVMTGSIVLTLGEYHCTRYFEISLPKSINRTISLKARYSNGSTSKHDNLFGTNRNYYVTLAISLFAWWVASKTPVHSGQTRTSKTVCNGKSLTKYLIMTYQIKKKKPHKIVSDTYKIIATIKSIIIILFDSSNYDSCIILT